MSEETYGEIICGGKPLSEWKKDFNNQFSCYELYRIMSEGGCINKMYIDFCINK